MENALDNIFSEQQNSITGEESSQGLKNELGLTFLLEGALFFSSIHSVKEVIEFKEIIPYPRKVMGHVGVINLRGKIIPILCPICPKKKQDNSCKLSDLENSLDKRIVVFETTEKKVFGVVVNNVRKTKVECYPDEDTKKEEIIDIDGRPHRYFIPDLVVAELN
ncbi:MAG: chemotaxis protein CheW [Bacteriovoracaceae bacterium]